ncbi:hypothetical protein [Levilactobacillus bambusae]|uniref:Glycosyltransferase RgtA/B/C/D-like domain-containing protein n=1 Tax=Levilactobacillus bambusae TaxID=2024736 RepID=A0A2V1N088_9LACO|nr:hypothetical protein [Levilactobacillus bambusae]PWG00158.1 hypothetical protein DCM90_04285 [Levilactobacillus bambusae]
MEKVNRALVTCLAWLGLGFTGGILLLALFKPINFLTIRQWLSPLTLLFGGVVLILLIRGVWWWLSQRTKKQLWVILGIVSVVMLACQIWVATHFEVSERADLYYVREQALNMLHGQTKWISYFYMYSNNVNFAILLSWWNRFTSAVGLPIYGASIYLAQFLWLDVGLACSAWIVNKLRGLAGSVIFIILCTVSAPLYYYALYIYTDMVVFPVTLISLAIVMKLTTAKTWWARLGWTILLGVVITFATLVKMNFLILLVAVILGLCLTKWHNHANWRIKTRVVLTLAAITLIGFAGDGVIKSANHYEVKDSQVMPIVHWIDMSWNPDMFGNYSDLDTKYMGQYHSKAKKTAVETKEFKSRIHKMGPKGIIKHLYRKTRLFLATGDFDIFRLYGPFYKSPSWYLSHKDSIEWNLGQWTQVLYVGLLMATLLFGWAVLKRRQVSSPIVMIAILFLFGLSFFHIVIWETEERYTLPLLAIWLLSGTLGLTSPQPVISLAHLPKWSRPAALIGCVIIAGICYVWDRPAFTTPILHQRLVVSQSVGQYYRHHYTKLKPGHSITQQFYAPVRYNLVKLGNSNANSKKMRVTLKNAQGKPLWRLNAPGQKIHLDTPQPAGHYQLTITNRTKRPLDVCVGLARYPLQPKPLNGFKETYLRFSIWKNYIGPATSKRLYLGILSLITLVGLAEGWVLTRKKER